MIRRFPYLWHDRGAVHEHPDRKLRIQASIVAPSRGPPEDYLVHPQFFLIDRVQSHLLYFPNPKVKAQSSHYGLCGIDRMPWRKRRCGLSFAPSGSCLQLGHRNLGEILLFIKIAVGLERWLFGSLVRWRHRRQARGDDKEKQRSSFHNRPRNPPNGKSSAGGQMSCGTEPPVVFSALGCPDRLARPLRCNDGLGGLLR